VSTKINEGMAGEYILDEITTRDETLYSDIRKLPSNSTLTIDSSGSLRVASWWDPDLSLLDYRTDEEYAEHFRRLLDQSILSQTRCNTPWGIELSGGLDSSSIAVSARAARGSREADPILTFSMACPGKRWDESDDIAAVVRQADLTAEFVQPLKVDLEFFRRRAAYSRDFPGNPNGEPMTIPMYEAARRRGARVLLTGVGGDEWLDGSPSHIVDLAARLGRPGTARQLIKRSKIDWRYYDRPHKHWSIFLLRRILSRVAPDWVHLRRTKLRLLRHSVFSEEFLGRTCLADRLAAPPEKENRPFATRAQRDAFRVAVSGAETYVFELNDREAALAGVEVRNPLFDRRLAEFCLRIPEDQRQQGTARKRMLRNAMHNRLPERVRAKTAKAEFSELFDAVCRTPQAAERLQNLSIRRHTGWFDPHRLERHIAELNQPASPDCPRPWARWMLLGTDLWFEHVLSSRVTFR
jgi:asparagine synthase (glutamine-hydrolysing)